ncbi:rRNA biogenesis protein rrp36 [Myotisia sp. PD_48]|nr:rRNA biogenesis protein rrp36 [Myotisia sp. PD_48]
MNATFDKPTRSMALSDRFSRRIRARPEEDEEEGRITEGEESDSANSQPDSLANSLSDDDDDDDDDGAEETEDDDEDEDEGSIRNDNNNINSSLSQISFGALAKAQESLGLLKKHPKRKHHDMDEDDDTGKYGTSGSRKTTIDEIRAQLRQKREEKAQSVAGGPPKLEHRSSKHAPTIQTSKRAVSRRRIVVDPDNLLSGPKSRDPRFDNIHGTSAPVRNPSGNKNYQFLQDYRVSELAELKKELGRTKLPAEKARLEKLITSMTDRQRAYDRLEKEKEVMAQHRKKERDLIKEGKKGKAWFLKKSELKKEVLKQQFEGMGARQRQKGLERRRKKMASKEKKAMPRSRRVLEE